MGKMVVVTALLLVIIAAAVLQNIYVINATEKLSAKLENIKEALEKEDFSTAEKTSDDFCALWDENKHTFEALFEHDEVDEISANAKSIQSLCHSGEKHQALSFVAAEIFYINHIRDIDTLGWENVF